jgi:hypothetical protein
LPGTTQLNVGPSVDSMLAFDTTPPPGPISNRSPFKKLGMYQLTSKEPGTPTPEHPP